MPFRKMKQKKYTGIYEYYRSSDVDKATVAYYINYRNSEGKPVKERTDANTPEEAVIALKTKIAARSRDKSNGIDHSVRLGEYAEHYFKNRNTLNNDHDHRRWKKHIATDKNLMNKKLTNISETDLEKLQQRIYNLDSYAPKTINVIVDLLVAIMNNAFQNKYISTPLRKIKKLSVDNERSRVLNEKELEYLLNAVDPRVRMILRLCYYTAQRPQSILNLQKKHIRNNAILIEAIKASKSHTVPISDKLKPMLTEWLLPLKDDDYLIHPVDNPSKSLSNKRLYETVSPMFEIMNVGLDRKKDNLQYVTLYTLRHTALTNVYASTGDIYVANKLANHSTIAMTQRYAKASDALKRKAVDVL